MADTGDAPAPSEQDYKVTFDKTGVTCARPDGTSEIVEWGELEAVTVEATLAEKPDPQFIWILWGEERQSGVVYPGGADGSDTVLDELKKRLKGFDHKALVTALNSDEHQTYVVWESSFSDSGSASQGNDAPNPFLIN